MGPTKGAGHGDAAHAAAGRRRRRAPARPHGRMPRRPRRDRARLRAGLRLRARDRRSGPSPTTGTARPTRSGREQKVRLHSDLQLGIEETRVRAPARPRGRATARSAPSRGAADLSGPDGHRRCREANRGDDALLASLARDGPHPGPSLARPHPALGADDQGPHLHADRRDRRGAHDVAAGDAGRRAQLGLPLHVDARHDVHAAGAALAEPRLGGRRVHAVRRRRRADRGRIAPDHVRDRRPPAAAGVDPRRAVRLRRAHGPFASATAHSTSARTTSSAPCSTRSTCTPHEPGRLPRRLWPIVETQAECATRVWREPDQGIWEARGKPQHYVSSKLMCWVALDRAAKLAELRGDPTLAARWSATADEIQRGCARARCERPRRAPSALRHGCTRCVDAPCRHVQVHGGRRRPAAQHRAGDRRRADGERVRPALQDRRDRRRPVGQGRHVPHLLVLARGRARDGGRAAAAQST